MKVWTTQTGEEIKVKDMTTTHIENCIKFLERKIKNGECYVIVGSVPWDWDDEPYADYEDITDEVKNWIRTFKRELKNRVHEGDYYQ